MNWHTKRKRLPGSTFNLNCIQLTTFSKFANSYISKFRISVVWCDLTKLLDHLTDVPKCFLCFSFYQSNLWEDMNLSYLHLVFLCWMTDPILLVGVHSLVLSNLTYISAQGFQLTAKWKTRCQTKPDNKIINTINHQNYWVVVVRSNFKCKHISLTKWWSQRRYNHFVWIGPGGNFKEYVTL